MINHCNDKNSCWINPLLKEVSTMSTIIYYYICLSIAVCYILDVVNAQTFIHRPNLLCSKSVNFNTLWSHRMHDWNYFCRFYDLINIKFMLPTKLSKWLHFSLKGAVQFFFYENFISEFCLPLENISFNEMGFLISIYVNYPMSIFALQSFLRTAA